MDEDDAVQCLSERIINKDLIQIKTNDEKEVQRRIDSFIKNKMTDVNERNIREFISPFGSDPDYSCARVEAVYVHREGMKSHINLKSVENWYGPQTRPQQETRDDPASSWLKSADIQRAEAVEERLLNMEMHLNIVEDGKDIFKRIKALEERIGFLEGISPEYFTNGIPQNSLIKPNYQKQDKENPFFESLEVNSLSDINKRIKQLKEILSSKSDSNRLSD